MATRKKAATPPAPPPPRRLPVLKILLLAVVFFIVAAAAFTYFYGGSALDSLVRSTIARVGTSTLGVNTSVSRAHINLTAGTATLSNLRIDNPKGFDADRFMSIGETDVGLNIASVRTDTIELTHVKLSDITVNLEGTPGSMNYNAILDKLKSQSGSSSNPKQKFIIRSLVLTNIKANVTVSPLPAVHIPIDRIELKDLGKDGLSASELTQVVVQSVLQSVASRGGGILPENLLGDLTHHLSSLKDLGIDALNEVQNQLDSTFGNFFKDAGSTVKGLFDSIIPPKEKKKDPP